MAKLEKLVPLILKWEGGYVNDPADLGGATNKGVTIATWRKQGYDKNGDGKIDVEDLKLISNEDVVERILRTHYWNRWQADRIDSQALANVLVDWVWCSGRYGITIPQGVLCVSADGIVGERTLWAVNNYPDPEGLFEKIKQVRRAYLNTICIDRPANKRFLKGWLNRLNDFKWIPMTLCFAFFFACKTSDKTVKTDFSLDENTKKRVEVTNHATKKTTRQENKLWNLDENIIIEKVSFYLDSDQIRQLDVTRVIKEKNVNGKEQTESQTKEKEETSADKSNSTIRQVEKHEVIVEKSWYKKPVVWLVGIGIVLVGVGLLLCSKITNP